MNKNSTVADALSDIRHKVMEVDPSDTESLRDLILELTDAVIAMNRKLPDDAPPEATSNSPMVRYGNDQFLRVPKSSITRAVRCLSKLDGISLCRASFGDGEGCTFAEGKEIYEAIMRR